MKKSLIILFALMGAIFASALEPVSLPTPWGNTCTLEGNHYTFDGSWAGAGTWYGTADKSAFDYVYIQYSNATGKVAFTVSYNEVESVQSWGNQMYGTTAVIETSADGGVVGLKLDKTHHLTAEGKTDKVFAQEVTQVTLQDQGVASTLTVDGIYFASEQEFLNAIGQGGDAEEGDPVITVWEGNQLIDWSTPGAFTTINAQCFILAKKGMKVRFNATDIKAGAVGNIRKSNWQDMAPNKSILGSFYEWDITDSMLTELQSNGCIVGGCGHTLVSVQLIDPAKIPNIGCTVEDGDIKAWTKDETPVLRIKAKNHQSGKVDLAATLTLRDDKFNYLGTLDKTLSLESQESQTLTFDLSQLITEPGFYNVSVVGNYSELCSRNIGYDPEGIVSPFDYQSDFDEFWANTKAELAAIDPDYTVTLLSELSTGKRNIYLVEMKSIDNGDGIPVTVRGYLAEPKEAGIYPAIIYQNGYEDTNTPADQELQWINPGTNNNPGWIEFNLSVRGQYINNRAPYKATDNIYGDYFAYNFGNKDAYFYRGAFMDVVRSIDFIMSRDNVQKYNVFMTGASQGGALTIAGGALDDRLNAIAPTVQFLCDFPDYFQVAQWPASVAFAQRDAKGMSDEEMYAFLSYFDLKNHAKDVTCPVQSALGLQDDVCPPHTGMSAFNNMASTHKTYIIQPFAGHGASNDYMSFFKSLLKDDSGIESVAVDSIDPNAPIYNVYGQKVTPEYKGIVIQNGQKRLVR